MQQEVFTVLIPEGWNETQILRDEIRAINSEGWNVVSVIQGIDEYVLVAEKEAPPPIMFSLPPGLPAEEIERFRKELTHQYEHGALQHHSPLMVTGNVQITRLADKGIQHVEITREMLDSWFGVDNSNDV